ncbi:MAG: tetratricopeptide repeat protein [Parachlamydiales bacterium]
MKLNPIMSFVPLTKPNGEPILTIPHGKKESIMYYPLSFRFHFRGRPHQIKQVIITNNKTISALESRMHKVHCVGIRIWGISDPDFIDDLAHIGDIADKLALPDDKLLQVANEMIEKKEYEDAGILLESAIELKKSQNIECPPPPDIRYFVLLGFCRFKQGNVQEALSWVEKALEFNPKHFDCNILIASIYKSVSNFESAEIHYRRVLNCQNYKSYEALAEFLEERLKFDEARKISSEAIALFPDQKAKMQTAFQRIEEKENEKNESPLTFF